MKMILSYHYWNGKYTIAVWADTPLSPNPKALIFYGEISKEQYDSSLNQAKDDKEGFEVKEVDDGSNIKCTITPKYLKL